VAASLVRLGLAQADPSGTAPGLYDPFCGSGTIAAEAARAGLPVFASDLSAEAVALTRERLAALPASSGLPGLEPGDLLRRVFVRDVRRGPDPRVTARLLVANMPWGKQVKVAGRLELFDATSRLAAHTARSGGAVVLLTTNEDQLLPRLRRRGLTAAARRIGLLGQAPAIVLAQPA
jgi:tRNA G10  N-methylase Trm11